MAGDVGASGSLLPWVLSIGGGIVTTLIAVVGKLWVSLNEERTARAAEREQLRHELAEANARVVELQRQAAERSDGHRVDHLRDLRRLAGLSSGTSGPWPAVISPEQRREVVIREGPPRPELAGVVRREDVRAPPPARKPR